MFCVICGHGWLPKIQYWSELRESIGKGKGLPRHGSAFIKLFCESWWPSKLNSASWSLNHKVLCITWLVRNNHYVCNIALFTLVAVIHCYCTVSFTASLMRPHKEWEEWQVWLGTRITTNISLQWHSDMDPRGLSWWHMTHTLPHTRLCCLSVTRALNHWDETCIAFMRGPDIQSSIFEASFHVAG